MILLNRFKFPLNFALLNIKRLKLNLSEKSNKSTSMTKLDEALVYSRLPGPTD
jgi:hypothetical protein